MMQKGLPPVTQVRSVLPPEKSGLPSRKEAGNRASLNPEHHAPAPPEKESSLPPTTVPCGSSTERYDWLGA